MNRALLQMLSASRWPIALGCAVLFVAAAGAAAWQGWRMLSAAAAPVFDRDAYPGEEHEFRFWLAALRRMEAEQHEQPAGTPMASLQREQAAVLQRLREAAERVPPERLPAEIAALLDRAAAMPALQSVTAAVPADAAAPRAADAAPQPVELRVGLGSRAEMPDFSSLAVSVPSLLPIVVERRPSAHRTASAARDDKRPDKDRDEKRPAR